MWYGLQTKFIRIGRPLLSSTHVVRLKILWFCTLKNRQKTSIGNLHKRYGENEGNFNRRRSTFVGMMLKQTEEPAERKCPLDVR